MKRNKHVLMICVCSLVVLNLESSDKYLSSTSSYRSSDDKYIQSNDNNSEFTSIQPLPPVKGATGQLMKGPNRQRDTETTFSRRSSMLPRLPLTSSPTFESSSSKPSSNRSSLESTKSSAPSSKRSSMESDSLSFGSANLIPYASQSSTPTRSRASTQINTKSNTANDSEFTASRSRASTQPNINAQPHAPSSPADIANDMSLRAWHKRKNVRALTAPDYILKNHPELKYSDPNAVEVEAKGAQDILRQLIDAENLYKEIFEKQDELQKELIDAQSSEIPHERKKIKLLEEQLDALQRKYFQEFIDRERLHARYWRTCFEELRAGQVSHK